MATRPATRWKTRDYSPTPHPPLVTQSCDGRDVYDGAMKNKTLAAWLAFAGGPFGLHRFYIYGKDDWLAWLLPVPTALGLYGIERIQDYGLDDRLSWVLVPLLGFTIAACSLNAIVYALARPEEWNERFNPGHDPQSPAGQTRWSTIFAIIASLLIGTTVLMSSIVYSFQRYFETQIEEARKLAE
jgi:hypothetical protein